MVNNTKKCKKSKRFLLIQFLERKVVAPRLSLEQKILLQDEHTTESSAIIRNQVHLPPSTTQIGYGCSWEK